MRPSGSDCPEQRVLAELLAGGEEVSPAVRAHVDQCAKCSQAVSELAGLLRQAAKYEAARTPAEEGMPKAVIERIVDQSLDRYRRQYSPLSARPQPPPRAIPLEGTGEKDGRGVPWIGRLAAILAAGLAAGLLVGATATAIWLTRQPSSDVVTTTREEPLTERELHPPDPHVARDQPPTYDGEQVADSRPKESAQDGTSVPEEVAVDDTRQTAQAKESAQKQTGDPQVLKVGDKTLTAQVEIREYSAPAVKRFDPATGPTPRGGFHPVPHQGHPGERDSAPLPGITDGVPFSRPLASLPAQRDLATPPARRDYKIVPLKLDVPDDAAQEEAERSIRSVMKAEFDAATRDDTIFLAIDLLTAATEGYIADDGTLVDFDSREDYVLLRLARDVAASVGDAETAFDALRKMEQRYAVGDVWKLRTETASKALLKATEVWDPNEPDERPYLIDAYQAAAWVLATCPESQLRDGKRALDYASEACRLSSWSDPDCLDALAAAYAESGDFGSASRWEKEAIRMDLPHEVEAEYRARLALYNAGKPFREE